MRGYEPRIHPGRNQLLLQRVPPMTAYHNTWFKVVRLARQTTTEKVISAVALLLTCRLLAYRNDEVVATGLLF